MNYQGQKLRGICLDNPIFAGAPLRSMSCHFLSTANLCTLNDEGNTPILRGHPRSAPPDVWPNVHWGAVYYGKRTGSFSFPDNNLCFDLSELNAWNFLIYENESDSLLNIYHQLYSNSTAYQRLMRRDQKNDPFLNLSSVAWTQADLDVYEDDWLGNLMPGGWCYTSRGVSEPMLGEIYYENAKKPEEPPNILDKSNFALARENWMPFCTPLKVYNKSGSLLGSFDGLSYIVFFNLAAVKVPLKKWKYDPALGDFTGEAIGGVRPRDKTLIRFDDNDLPWLDPKRQIMSIEVWFYLNSSNPSAFKSPRFATARWWHYTKGLAYLDAGPYTSPFNPYLFLSTNTISEFLKVPITFQLLKNQNNPENISNISKELKLKDFVIFLGA